MTLSHYPNISLTPSISTKELVFQAAWDSLACALAVDCEGSKDSLCKATWLLSEIDKRPWTSLPNHVTITPKELGKLLQTFIEYHTPQLGEPDDSIDTFNQH